MLKGIPSDSPLYEVDEERGIEYRNCEAITGFFTIKNDVEDLLPEGLKPYSKPAQGGIWISHYSFSTVGEYHEYLTVIQVEDEQGDMGYYIPYIYVYGVPSIHNPVSIQITPYSKQIANSSSIPMGQNQTT